MVPPTAYEAKNLSVKRVGGESDERGEEKKTHTHGKGAAKVVEYYPWAGIAAVIHFFFFFGFEVRLGER